mgnify:CR=1 FL=1
MNKMVEELTQKTESAAVTHKLLIPHELSVKTLQEAKQFTVFKLKQTWSYLKNGDGEQASYVHSFITEMAKFYLSFLSPSDC